MKAKFQVGDFVYHLTAERTGRVAAVFFDGEQPRYYVQHSGWDWSVPQENLVFSTKQNQVVADREKTQTVYRPSKASK